MRLIDADALKKDLSENYVFYGFRQLLNDFYEALDSAPTIDIPHTDDWEKYSERLWQRAYERGKADRPSGEWIDMGDFEQCSVCKGTHLKEIQTYYGKATWIKTPYCPNCGAKMKGADDEYR